jgi:hypothetical protein
MAINGGAAIALLAFSGALIARSNVPKDQVTFVLAKLSWFASGVFAAAIAGAFAYFTNFCYAGMAAFLQPSWEEPFIEETRKSKRWKRTALACHWLGVLSALASLLLFLGGLFAVRTAMLRLI